MSNFEKLVSEALEDLPESIRSKMDNVAICIENSSKKRLKEEGLWKKGVLLGLYEGVPQNAWGRGFGDNLPDKITIFEDSIRKFAKTDEGIKEMVKKTVYHEIAHHFGFNEEEARRLEKIYYEKNRDN